MELPLTICHSTGQSEIRVLKDDAPIERTEYNDREAADSDKQLGKMHHQWSSFIGIGSNIYQSVTRRMPSTRATSLTSVHVALLSSLEPTLSLATMKVLRVPLRVMTVPRPAVSKYEHLML